MSDETFGYKEQLNNKTNPDEIIEIISLISKKNIDEDWLLIFDEIQEIPSLRTSLKLFVERNIKIKIVCLGSYLGNLMNNNDNYSFPVGKVERLYMYPLNFKEYMIATNNTDLINDIEKLISTGKLYSNQKHKFLIDLMHEFMIVGGMPRVVDE